MPRPKTASDAEILMAAHRVYAEHGPRGFTLSQVAREVGISRAAIIQRFESVQSLKLVLTEQVIHAFNQRMEALPVERSGDAVLSLVHYIGSMIPTREQQAAFSQNLQTDLRDKQIAKLEEERKAAWYKAISQRLPATGIKHDRAVELFAAHVGGVIVQWQTQPETGCASDYLVARTRDWLRMAGVSYSRKLKEYPAFQKK